MSTSSDFSVPPGADAAAVAAAWAALEEHARTDIAPTHLRELLKDRERCSALTFEGLGMLLDMSRQRMQPKTLELLVALARATQVPARIAAMARGERINSTEDRSVLHIALRSDPKDKYVVDGHDVVPDVHAVLARVQAFAERVRSGEWRGATGRPLTSVLAVGIGGSFLGAKFVAEALQHDNAHGGADGCKGRTLRFLANVDPVDVARATAGLDPEETLVIVLSKTFTTAETMLNAETVKQWLVAAMTAKVGGDAAAAAASIARAHVCACSTAVAKAVAFGVEADNVFPFWDWVGGRYSVCSAVGVLPLALHLGWDQVKAFLAGARAVDTHFLSAPLERNLPALLALVGVWNSSVLGLPARSLACYAEALCEFAAHIQQVDMESNGKRVGVDGRPLAREAGEITFGQPGTNSQHSYFQLLHQGRVVPVDFIGVARSQHDRRVVGGAVSNHDELMANFFAQPDALAEGIDAEAVAATGVPAALVPHKVMPGNRPSSVLLLPRLSAGEVGALLALYEHRTAVQGFVWGLNSFDQFGVELGKVLAGKVRTALVAGRKQGTAGSAAAGTATDAGAGTDAEPQPQPQEAALAGFNPSTQALLRRYGMWAAKL